MINPRVIRDSKGNIESFICTSCGNGVDKMWCNKCNQCRKEEERHQEILKAIKESNA